MDKDICFCLSSLTALKLGSPGSTKKNYVEKNMLGKMLKTMSVLYVAVEAAYHDHDYQILWYIHNNHFQRKVPDPFDRRYYFGWGVKALFVICY